MIGLAAAWTKAELISNILIEFQKIVLAIVTRIMIPILPLFIGLTFCTLSYEGSITKQAPVFLKIIIIVLLGHYIWMALLYTIAGIYTKKNPLDVIKCYGPAYLTAIGTMIIYITKNHNGKLLHMIKMFIIRNNVSKKSIKTDDL